MTAGLDKEFDAIEAEVAVIVREAREFAEASPVPAPETATRHVYAEPPRVVQEPMTVGTRTLTFSQATLEALSEEMAVNPNIWVMGEGIGKRGGNPRQRAFMTFTGLNGFAIRRSASGASLASACGAGMTGTRPVIDFMFADFVLDGIGEIITRLRKCNICRAAG